jgi:hypothetical protein
MASLSLHEFPSWNEQKELLTNILGMFLNLPEMINMHFINLFIH